MRARVHYSASTSSTIRIGVCGIMGAVTDVREAVTCTLCRARLPAPPFEPSPPRAIARGAHTLTLEEERIIERSRLGDDAVSGPRWRSLAAAFELWAAVRDEPTPIRGTWRDPAEGGPSSTRGGSGRDDVIAVDIALAQSFSAVEQVRGRALPGHLCRLVLQLRVAGEPVRKRVKSKGAVRLRQPCTEERVAELVEQHLGLAVSRADVREITVRGRSAAVDFLIARGMLPRSAARLPRPSRAHREEGSSMPIPPGYDLEGLKEIAASCGMSEATLRRAMNESSSPPIGRYGGRFVARRSEMQAWARARVTAAAHP